MGPNYNANYSLQKDLLTDGHWIESTLTKSVFKILCQIFFSAIPD